MVMNFAEPWIPFYVSFLSEWLCELAEEPRIVPPVLMDADMEVEVDLRAEDRFQLLPGFGADALDHRALLA